MPHPDVGPIEASFVDALLTAAYVNHHTCEPMVEYVRNHYARREAVRWPVGPGPKGAAAWVEAARQSLRERVARIEGRVEALEKSR
jgi:hypothetical protein